MAERKQITVSLPTELVDSLDVAARERCVGRGLLVEVMLTQGLRLMMPADSYLFGVELAVAEDRGQTHTQTKENEHG